MPTAALAAESTVTIESQTNSAFDYLEYYKDGSWHDLNTPRHVIEQTGEICYCIEHSEGNPHGDTYTAASPSSVFSTNTLAGVQAIMTYGYPCNTPSGFTADEARQATANALRFWLSENGESGSYSFTNRKANPTHIRAKAGYEHVLEWADTLLSYARAKKTLTHSIAMGFSETAPSPYVTWNYRKDAPTHFFWGHYFSNEAKAMADYEKRIDDEVRYYEEHTHRKFPLPALCLSIEPSSGDLINIKRGMKGYFPSDWNQPNEKAHNRETADYANEKIGVTKAQEAAMLHGSMFGWDIPAANPKSYADTREQSRLIDNYLNNSKSKFKRIIQNK